MIKNKKAQSPADWMELIFTLIFLTLAIPVIIWINSQGTQAIVTNVQELTTNIENQEVLIDYATTPFGKRHMVDLAIDAFITEQRGFLEQETGRYFDQTKFKNSWRILIEFDKFDGGSERIDLLAIPTFSQSILIDTIDEIPLPDHPSFSNIDNMRISLFRITEGQPFLT